MNNSTSPVKSDWAAVFGTDGAAIHDNDGTVAVVPDDLSDWRKHARVIAAAPDLLEALQSLFKHCEMVHKHWGEDDNTKQANEAQRAARNAIAKATEC